MAQEADYIICGDARRNLKECCPGRKYTARKELNARIEALIFRKNTDDNEYRGSKASVCYLMGVYPHLELTLTSQSSRLCLQHR